MKRSPAGIKAAAEYSVCPDCRNPSEFLQQEDVDDEWFSIVIISCPVRGWIQGMGIHRKQQPLD